MITLKYIVVGTGRCGTKTVKEFFDDKGIHCSHENIFGIDLNSGEGYSAASSWLAVPHLNTDMISGDAELIHLVRNPLHVIKSFYDISQFDESKKSKYHMYMKKHLPKGFFDSTELGNICKYYMMWNTMIEESKPKFGKNHFHRLEDGFCSLSEKLG